MHFDRRQERHRAAAIVELGDSRSIEVILQRRPCPGARAHVHQRAEVIPTVQRARTSGKTFLINFQVEKEDGVYPMIAPGAALHDMVRRPNPLLELPEDA